MSETTAALRLNLNADLGEHFGVWRMGDDARILPHIGSASLPCGYHAGDPVGLRRSLALARTHGVSVGAHPSWPDLAGFGRRAMQVGDDETEALVIYQLGALGALAQAESMTLSHVKPHGALSNQAARDEGLATAICRAIVAFDPSLILLAPACSALQRAGHACGLRTASEIFADRRYEDDGQLTPRSQPDAVIEDDAERIDHLIAMVQAGAIKSRHGRWLPTRIDSVCLHGDSPGAARSAATIATALQRHGIELVSLPALFETDVAPA